MKLFTIITGVLLCASTAVGHGKHEGTSLKRGIFAKVVAPVGRDFQDKQDDSPCECMGEPSGVATCFCEHIDGFITVFQNCPVFEDGSLLLNYCGSCELVEEDSALDIDSSDPTCNDCTICPSDAAIPYSVDCSNIDPSEPCLVFNCDAHCLGGDREDDEDGDLCRCFEDEEAPGWATCYCQSFGGLITRFEDCEESSDDLIYIADSASCRIVEEQNILQFDDESIPTCNDCQICPSNSFNPFSMDCSNFDPTDPCMVKNCVGQCIGGPTTTTVPPRTTTASPATTTAPPPRDGCELDQWTNTQTCRYQDVPFDGLTLVFDSCPASSTSLMDCQSCTISETESSTSRQTGRACNQCTMCSPDSTHTVSFDCSNLVPSNPCNIQDCSGNCIGQDNPGFPTPRPAEPTQPGFGFGDASLVAVAPVMILGMLIAAMGSAL